MMPPNVPKPSPSFCAATRARPQQSADGAGRPGEPEAAEKRQDEEASISEQQASAEYSAFQARFDIPGRTSVLATGEVKRVLIDEVKIEPTLVVRTVPRLRTQAYLYAKLAAPKTSAYLPGEIALFRDEPVVPGA